MAVKSRCSTLVIVFHSRKRPLDVVVLLHVLVFECGKLASRSEAPHNSVVFSLWISVLFYWLCVVASFLLISL